MRPGTLCAVAVAVVAAVAASAHSGWQADPSLPHVEDEIEARGGAAGGFCHAHHQLATEQAVAPIGGLVGKIELGREQRSLRCLHLDVIMTCTAEIERRLDGA